MIKDWRQDKVLEAIKNLLGTKFEMNVNASMVAKHSVVKEE